MMRSRLAILSSDEVLLIYSMWPYLRIMTHCSRVLVRMSFFMTASRAPPPLIATSRSVSSESPGGKGSSRPSSRDSSNIGFLVSGGEPVDAVGGGTGPAPPIGGSDVRTVGGGRWTFGLPSASTLIESWPTENTR